MAPNPIWEAEAVQQFISGVFLPVSYTNDNAMQTAGIDPGFHSDINRERSVSPSQKLSWIEVLDEAGIHSAHETVPSMSNDGSAMEIETVESFLANNENEKNATISNGSQKTGFINGERAALFHHASMLRGKTPVITYNEVSPQLFIARVEVENELLGESGPCTTKKAAKDEVCGIALLPFEAKYPIINGKGKKKTPTEQPHLEEDLTEILAENWIGELNSFAQIQRLGAPVYDDYAENFSMGPFSCTVTVPGLSSEKFGTGKGPFRQKANAKKAAAMDAIRWIRANSAQTVKSPSVKPSSQTPQVLSKQSISSPSSPTSGNDKLQLDDHTLPQRANTLATSLGISPPGYDIVPLGDGFCQASARFSPKDVRYHPELLGQVGKVERVYGRKTAKVESAREVIRILEDIQKRRDRAR
ncbi:uncharacterized protein K489DRAFT_429377 [Dissoconium aciculare CBS 342.82]|uniref:DRBM domain-containing protein n=1 Tax=Dissoconium aciculare CBS 342.82 TaxID=1314786 RepID=A0A6J3MBQ7_9PEZI|nr:uncharacterized protein K489DRAFT_429377 [Dissoconium aciculare CBS 342.82]KAF1825059.1 hypothetical protein K489DRAFT_429377 [Dissoconium aciculare CBS 342.82]